MTLSNRGFEASIMVSTKSLFLQHCLLLHRVELIESACLPLRPRILVKNGHFSKRENGFTERSSPHFSRVFVEEMGLAKRLKCLFQGRRMAF